MSNTVRDVSGRVKYTITYSGNKKMVRDAAGRCIGFMLSGNTYSSAGFIVAYGEDPSALF